MRERNGRINYFEWLLDRVGFRRKGYTQLMLCLFNIPFEAVIERDNNRMDDAMSLRSEYGQFSYFMEGIPNVLEVLIALAIRIEDEYIGDPSDLDPEPIFWEMCCNLGLERYTDRFFNSDRVYEIIVDWLDRDFDPNGEGSIFPIKNPSQDQRDVEIWSQMQEYLSENYS